MKAKRLLAVLERKPLGYRVARQSGSHRRMESPNYPPLTFAFHDKATIPSGLVRKILVRDVGLAEDEARKLLWIGEVMEIVRVIYHHESDGWWAESPDVEGWSAAGNSYAEVVKLAEDGIPFALGHEVTLENFVPAGEHVAA
jgi:predicted RNA binding protein YcfA (HicA-like mRNA interferase family)/predicted RNase H-like HicB family nuclease